MFYLNSAGLQGVCFFQRWTPRSKKIAQSFLSTGKFTAKYSSERFLSICGEKIYLSHAKQMCDHMCDHKCDLLLEEWFTV